MNMLNNWKIVPKEVYRAELSVGNCTCCGNTLSRFELPKRYITCMFTRCKLFGKKFEVPTIELKEVS